MTAIADGFFQWRNVTALPVAHGRLGFALEVRRRMLATRFDAIAVELPGSLKAGVESAIERLPVISVVTYRDRPDFLGGENVNLFYVPVEPCDPVVEAIRIAQGERTPVHYIDAEIDEFESRPIRLPDSHAIAGLGLAGFYESILRFLRMEPRTAADRIRERHMAARLRDLSERLGPDRRILLLCGLAHWEPIRTCLESGTFALHAEKGPGQDLVRVHPVHPGGIPHLLSEIPGIAWHYERTRRRLLSGDYDPSIALKTILLQARVEYERDFPASLEKASTRALDTLLSFARKVTVRERRLYPDAHTLLLAAKGVVGNDYAISLLFLLMRYPPNQRGPADKFLLMTEDRVQVDDGSETARSRVPREPREWKSLTLRSRPDPRKSESWRRQWNPMDHCSWSPEDVAIENFREYVARRAKYLAGLSRHRTEPFRTSFKDGLDIRETIRNWHSREIHVREEPPSPHAVGAVVMIFEEDDFGMRFPWRVTWMAEHPGESTLAFYSTYPTDDIVGPGIARIFYGGCFFLFPPLPIPCVWDDPRFERARTPSERLLLAAIYYSDERYVVYAAARPPPPEMKQQAAALGKHVIFVPLSSFSAPALERLRRAHVLDSKEARAYADRFIR